jgi:MinD-like ATPase involved in chromosome partitioning or flagellar assembly
MRGRKFGLHVVLASQDFAKSSVGRVRDQMHAVCFRVRSAELARAVGCTGAERIPARLSGRAVTARWGIIQAFYLDKSHLVSVSAETPTPVLSEPEQALVAWALRENDGYLGLADIQARTGLGPWPARKLAEEWEQRGWLTKDAQAGNKRRITGELAGLDMPPPGDDGDNGAKRGPAPKLALAVWSGSAGGTGKSTIAAELAALASDRAQTVLVGLNEPGGVVAGLGVRPRPDLLDVIDEGAEPQRRARLGLIPAPSEPGRVKAMLDRGGELAMLLGSLAGAYDVTVFDMPSAMVGTPVREVIGAAGMLLYVIRPVAADGAVAARVLAALAHMTRLPVRVAWNMTQGGALAPKEVQQGVEAAAVVFPDVVGSVPYHKGVVAARDRQQLLCEAETDGLVPAPVTDAVKAIAGSLFGWEPEPDAKSTFRLPGIKLKVVD